MDSESTFRKIVAFLKHPSVKTEKKQFTQNLYDAFKVYLIFFIVAIVAIIIRYVIVKMILSYDIKDSVFPQSFSNINPLFIFSILVLTAPLIEELTFRYLLTDYCPKRISVSLSLMLGCLTYFFFQNSILVYNNLLIDFTLMVLQPVFFAIPVFPIIFFLIRKYSFNNYWYKHFPFIFYFTTILFALLHIMSLNTDSISFIFVPLLVIPQFIMGLSFGYIRIKYGIGLSILFHFFNNLPAMFGFLYLSYA